MTASNFVHLHVHSEFSLLRSTLRINALVERVAKLGMPAVALTDLGTMFGALQFYEACKRVDIVPIIGCEVILQPEPDSHGHHLVILAKGQEGYRNLVRLTSLGWVEGLIQGVPHVTLEHIKSHRQGLIGLSGCLAGHLAQEVLNKGPEKAQSTLTKLADCFEPEHFFVELQNHGLIEQGVLNEILAEQAAQQGIPLVASNDCHFMHADDAQAHTVLLCIGEGQTLDVKQAYHHNCDQMYLKSAKEMHHCLDDYPEACANTLRIAQLCGDTANPCADVRLPQFQVPGDINDADTYLRDLAKEGLVQRFEAMNTAAFAYDESLYRKRLDDELDVICSMGFAGYFLIVQDFINWAKNNDVPVGPGRGSGAGSLVAWVLRITDLNPIEHGLLFERFLNPERVSMPDFDIDFCMEQRDRVIDYVREQYGAHSVGQIATFHQLKSRSVVRDVGRVMGLSPMDAGRIASLVPEPVQGKTVPIVKALEKEVKLKQAYEQNPETTRLLDTAITLEDLNRHAGMHAAGVVISDGDLWDHVPVFCPEPHVYVTQFDKDDVERAGLVKFDFLGLKTLTVIDLSVKLVRQRPHADDQQFRLENIPIDDAATFELLQSGETTNVFQLESSGMQSLFKRLRPDSFEDIVAAVALYRPGPLGSGMVEDFIQRKHGRVAVQYPHPNLQPILKDTYGVIVYQEQVMEIARQMAGYSLGSADLLRRAMGKKKAEEMAQQKNTFVQGAIAKGYRDDEATKVFDLMAYFAGYGFNKSHSAAYALITYQTAYLKAHYPSEFLCATLSADKEKIDKVVRTIAEARALGIIVLPPDINESKVDFTVSYDELPQDTPPNSQSRRPVCRRGRLHDPANPRIRFGLGAIKGVGVSAVESILQARQEESEEDVLKSATEKHIFSDLFDCVERVDSRAINKHTLEALIQSGAFDSVHQVRDISRAQAFSAIDSALERGRKYQAEKRSGQTTIFALMDAASPASKQDKTQSQAMFSVFPQVPNWSRYDELKREKGALGFYVSGHPMDNLTIHLSNLGYANTAKLASFQSGTELSLGGMVEDFRQRTTKQGQRIAFGYLEDHEGRVELIVRAKVLENETILSCLTASEPVLIKGQLKREEDHYNRQQTQELKIVVSDAFAIDHAFASQRCTVNLCLDIQSATLDKLSMLRETLRKFPGSCPVTLELQHEGYWRALFPEIGLQVQPERMMLEELRYLVGPHACNVSL